MVTLNPFIFYEINFASSQCIRLALVYECGSEEMKGKLVSELVTTIAHGKGGFKVTANTELFPKGFLGNTPSGIKLIFLNI